MYPEELELETEPAPKPKARLRTEPGPGARPAQRGQAIDSLDIEIEPAATTPIARMTREPASHKTMIGAAVPRPAAPPPPPARRPASPSAPPQARTMIAEAPELDTHDDIEIEMPPPRRPAAPQAPTMIAPQAPRPAAQAPTMIAPAPAVQAPAMIAPAPSPVIIDVTPRGLGIGTVAGFCEELIQRNARLPAERRKVFTTVRDRQDSVRIIVVQGESRRIGENVVLGDLTLSEITPRPRGETSIEVTFALDAGGILHVRARDTHSGREQRASLSLAGALPESAIDASRDRLSALRR
jgi:molecular chaperone DnaK